MVHYLYCKRQWLRTTFISLAMTYSSAAFDGSVESHILQATIQKNYHMHICTILNSITSGSCAHLSLTGRIDNLLSPTFTKLTFLVKSICDFTTKSVVIIPSTDSSPCMPPPESPHNQHHLRQIIFVYGMFVVHVY